MKSQQYSSRTVERRQKELGKAENKVRDHGVVETGSVGQDRDPCTVGPGTSSDLHTVRHKHRSGQCSGGLQQEGHRRKLHQRDECHKGARRRGDWRTDPQGARCTAGLGRDCTAAHSKGRRRAERNDAGNRVRLAVSSGWTGPVCTP